MKISSSWRKKCLFRLLDIYYIKKGYIIYEVCNLRFVMDILQKHGSYEQALKRPMLRLTLLQLSLLETPSKQVLVKRMEFERTNNGFKKS